MRARGIARGLLAASILGAVVAPTSSSAVEPAARRRPAYVRVNQLGYPADAASKRAYLMSSSRRARRSPWRTAAEPSTPRPSGATSAGGRGPSRTSTRWTSTRSRRPAPTRVVGHRAGAGDLAAVRDRHRHRRLRRGAARTRSRFYQVQRDGPDYIPSALRTAPGHLNDANAMTYLTPNVNCSGRFSGDLTPLGTRIDASGGWWDAGDYLKFVHASSYTEAMLLAGVRDFPNQMGAGASANGSDFTAEARFGANWLLNMWDDPTPDALLPGGDRQREREDRQRPRHLAAPAGRRHLRRHRPALPLHPQPAGVPRRPARLADQPEPRRPRRRGARALLPGVPDERPGARDPVPDRRRAHLRPRGHEPAGSSSPRSRTASIPRPSGGTTSSWARPSSTSRSRPAACRPACPTPTPPSTCGRAAHWADAYITGPNDAADTLNLYDVSGLAHFELHRAITAGGEPAGLAVTRARLLADMQKALDGAIAQGAADAFGFGFAWAQWDTTTHGAGLSVMASEVRRADRHDDYAAYADRWLANILGANAWGLSLIVGDGTTFPHCLQHQVANLAGSLDGSPPVLPAPRSRARTATARTGASAGCWPARPTGSTPFAPFNGSGAEFRDNMRVVPEHRARDRPDGDLEPAGVRAAGRGTPLSTLRA